MVAYCLELRAVVVFRKTHVDWRQGYCLTQFWNLWPATNPCGAGDESRASGMLSRCWTLRYTLSPNPFFSFSQTFNFCTGNSLFCLHQRRKGN